MEHQAESVAASGPEHADAVAHRRLRPAPGAVHGTVPGGEDERLAPADGGGRGPGLGPGPLLDDHELAPGVVLTGLVETDDDLQGEHQVAIEIAVQGIPVAGAVAQDERRGPG